MAITFTEQPTTYSVTGSLCKECYTIFLALVPRRGDHVGLIALPFCNVLDKTFHVCGGSVLPVPTSEIDRYIAELSQAQRIGEEE